jgi:hypothetical protein
MIEYWVNIFATAVKARMEREGRTVDDILSEYVLISAEDKMQIKNHIET